VTYRADQKSNCGILLANYGITSRETGDKIIKLVAVDTF